MSLWHKSVEELTYADIDAYCKAKLPEGPRLDYKLHMPNNLEKTIAAFANTLGGIILIGVDEDKQTNTPMWPPAAGLPITSGLSMQIFQKATETIYPPVRVSVSSPLEIPHLTGQCVIVIRIDESKEAPHAIAKGREIYIYERSDNKTDPLKLAHVNRIEYLLNRRKRIEEDREAIRSKAISRAKRLVGDRFGPIIWLSIIPLYPWKELCRPSVCYNHFSNYPRSGVQRIPDGGMFREDIECEHLGAGVHHVISCDCRGHFLYLSGLIFVSQRGTRTHYIVWQSEWKSREFDFVSVEQRIKNMLNKSISFYKKNDVERPGLLSIKLGLSGVLDAKIHLPNAPEESKCFMDSEYETELIVSIDELLSGDKVAQTLSHQIAFAFDVSTPESQ